MPGTETEKTRSQLLADVDELSRRLEETEQVLEAIQSGSIDAVVVSASDGEKVYTLQGAEHPYRVFVETMNEGAATLSSDGIILYCNKRLADMLQYPQEKLTGTALSWYASAADAPLFAARLQRCSNACEKQEMALVTGDGAHLPVLISCCAAEFAGSQSLSVIVTDISVRKQAEKTILRLNRLYAVLGATSHAILHAGNRLSIFREFCRVAVEIGGFRLAWVGLVEEGRSAIRVAAASGETSYLDELPLRLDRDSEGMGPVSAAIQEGSHYICNDFSRDECARAWHQRANAHGLYASASIAIEQDQQVVGALTLYAEEADFFDAQQVELLQQMGAEVSFALDHLHQSILRSQAEQALQSETTERLRVVQELRNNEQILIHQSRQAALGEMIGNIAHQWRQPLNTLGLLVQQAPLYYTLGEVDLEYLQGIARKSMQLIDHMSRTIDDFRDFFKPNKEKVVFSVKEEVTKTLSIMQGSFLGERIQVDVEVRRDAAVNGFPNEFSQVLLNILVNARDALMERGVAAPRVLIRIDEENGRAVVTVSDNAGGIPEEILERIFEPYFTTKGAQSGTGVGLFMSKTIIEKNMGGVLSVRNAEEGAEFRIEV